MSSERHFRGGGRERALVVRRSAQARRYRLAVDPADGRVRLTVPRRAALAPALAWAESQRGWIENALAALPPPLAIEPGAALPFAGGTLTVAWEEGGSRTPRREGDLLRLGGPPAFVAARVLRWLRGEAARVLETETRALAGRAGIAVGRVRVGDPRARWGSCSSTGDIAYSWRLLLAPPAVLEATVAHELAHRRHMDHSPAFHAAVAELLGREPKAERAWLRANGARLQAIGR